MTETFEDRKKMALEWFNYCLGLTEAPSPNMPMYKNCVETIRERLAPSVPVDPLISMIWPISHDRGDFLAVGIALDNVKKLYQAAQQPRQDNSVKIPTSIDEARLMAVLGTNYLLEHAPQYLKIPPAIDDGALAEELQLAIQYAARTYDEMIKAANKVKGYEREYLLQQATFYKTLVTHALKSQEKVEEVTIDSLVIVMTEKLLPYKRTEENINLIEYTLRTLSKRNTNGLKIIDGGAA